MKFLGPLSGVVLAPHWSASAQCKPQTNTNSQFSGRHGIHELTAARDNEMNLQASAPSGPNSDHKACKSTAYSYNLCDKHCGMWNTLDLHPLYIREAQLCSQVLKGGGR